MLANKTITRATSYTSWCPITSIYTSNGAWHTTTTSTPSVIYTTISVTVPCSSSSSVSIKSRRPPTPTTTTTTSAILTTTTVYTVTSCGSDVVNCPAAVTPYLTTETLLLSAPTVHPVPNPPGTVVTQRPDGCPGGNCPVPFGGSAPGSGPDGGNSTGAVPTWTVVKGEAGHTSEKLGSMVVRMILLGLVGLFVAV